MSSIILPRRALVQPQGAEILSASDGTWQAEFVHGFANGADLTGHGYTLQTRTSVVHEAYERGVRAYITNHAAGAAADIAISRGLYVAASEPFFSVVQYRTDSGSDGSGGLLCLRNTSANPICSMFVGSNGITGLAGNATFIVRDSSGSLSRHETTTAVNDGLMHTSAVRRFNGRWQWSLDGSPWADFATSPTNAQGAITFTPDRMFYGREPTGTAIGNVFQGFFEFGMVGRGTLNDAQIATVHQNPWLLFKQSPRRLYFDAVAVGDGSITGNLAATESGSDTAAFVGDVIISGDLAATESGSDTAAFSGDVIVSGTLAATETGSDTAAFTGTVPLSTITGTLDATESGSDSASFIGAGVVTRTQHVVRYIYRPYSNATERKYIEQLNEDLRTLYGQIAALSRGSVSGHDARESAPVGGTWQQGDFVRKFSPTEQGTSGSKYIVTGWSCVASGSPGTWVECRVLTGN